MTLKPLLPNEPRIYNLPQESELTVKYLFPAINDIYACFLALRLQLDPILRQAQPVKLGKPYPLGQCLEISLAVQRALRTQSPDGLPVSAARGLRAIQAFMKAGGSFRQVWGDLRGQFFQNAFLLGTLYVDVSNDTVTPTKPKVEIMPFDQAGFVPIRDFEHFSELAQRYWNDRVFPNHVLPELAPWCPLVHVSSEGRVRLHDATHYMLGMTTSQGFEPSETVLRQPAMADDLFRHIQACLSDSTHALLKDNTLAMAANAIEGRTQALQNCRAYRARRLHKGAHHIGRMVTAVKQVNTLLAGHPFTQVADDTTAVSEIGLPEPAMTQTHEVQTHGQAASVAAGAGAGAGAVDDAPSTPQTAPPDTHFNPLTADLNTLPPEARAHAEGLRFVEAELHRLNAMVAALQVARQGYLDALSGTMNTPPAGT
ncbi:MAG: hypothetical protein AB7E59_01110 [Pusillimonas sp.]